MTCNVYRYDYIEIVNICDYDIAKSLLAKLEVMFLLESIRYSSARI